MGILLLLIFFTVGVFNKQSKIVTALILLLMWILLAFNTVSPDGESYLLSYNNYINLLNHYEPLYTLIVSVGHRLNYSFDKFRAVYSMFIVAFTYLGCKRFSLFTSKALALYLVTFFLWYISGMRIALAIAIVIFATSFLLSDTKKSLIIFCVILFAAVMIHYSCALFYLLILARQKEINWKRFVCIFAIACIVTMIVLNTDILYSTVTRFTNRDKTTSWFVNDKSAAGRPTIIGLITSLIIVFGNIIVSYYAKKFSKKTPLVNKEEQSKTILIYNANCSMMLLLPLLFININFMRPYIGMSVITLFGITDTLEAAICSVPPKKNMTIFTLVTILWLLYYSVLYNFDIRVWEMVTNNRFFIF